METVSCVLCGSDQSTPCFRLADYWLERLAPQFTFVRCERCGLVYQNPRPSIDEIGGFYPQEYEVFQSGMTRKAGRGYRYGMNRRSQFITRYKPSGRLLDVGCATGSFLQWMGQKGGWDLCGVEMSEHASQAARQQGLNVFTGVLEAAQFPPAFFDVITLWDVVEHLHDPVSTLLEVNRILQPEGIVILRLPNLDSIDARIFGPYWAGLDAPRHLYVFRIQTLKNLLKKAGFDPVEMSCQVGGYLNFVKSVRFALVGKGVTGFPRKLLPRLLTSWPARICLTPFFYLKDMHLRGSEVVVVARKSPGN